MINVGFYYRVKKGHEREFEEVAGKIFNQLRMTHPGFRDAKLYRNVNDPQDYLLFSEWDDLDSFKSFISSDAYRDAVSYGRTIIEGRPLHRIMQQVEQQ
ncbi:antibiotic biosynthesis monooxygenase [Thermocladium modestius]|uniref:antibiotic biosynthesis monooxygenase n=1 Tax=Thermocladium modestius TaxID=62609 RepID=UPI0009465059